MSDKHFSPCPVIFREPDSPYVTDEDKLAEILEFLRSIGEPNLGAAKKDLDFLCRQITSVRMLIDPPSATLRVTPRCHQTVPPWVEFLDAKIQAHSLWGGRYSSFNPQDVAIRLFVAAKENQTLFPQEIMDGILLLKKDFCRTCRAIAHAHRQKELAKMYLASAEKLYTRTMEHFIHLRITLPRVIDKKIHWRS